MPGSYREANGNVGSAEGARAGGQFVTPSSPFSLPYSDHEGYVYFCKSAADVFLVNRTLGIVTIGLIPAALRFCLK